MKSFYDVVVIGAGHNGLVAACYLARGGLEVGVFERRHIVGGACITEEVFDGCKVSRLAYLNGIFRPKIVDDLRLHAYGFEVLTRDPSSFTPFPDNRYLFLGPDQAFNCREIAKFSHADAEAYPKYEAMLDRLAKFIEPTLMKPPPNPTSNRLSDLLALGKFGLDTRKLGDDLGRMVSMMTGSARTMLDAWFESEQLKVTLATDAIIGAFAAPSMPGTAYVLFHHVMGETDGARGVWGFVRGGMGALSNALAAAARDLGVDVECNAPVSRIIVKNGRAVGVALEDGREVRAASVVSNADANVTFLKLMDPRLLPDEFVEAVRRIRYDSASVKINVLLGELPDFSALPGGSGRGRPGSQHRGTIHICPTLDYIERAYDDAKYGRPSESPVLECTFPTVLDDTLAPNGKHLMNMFVQYGPYRLAEGQGTWDEIKESFADRCIEVLAQYAPNIKNAVLDREIVSPLDMEREFSLTGGNIFQGAMTLDQLLFMRPVFGYADYTTPIAGLHLCGAATHPGGGVMGACGHNAAMRILKGR